MLDDYSPRSRWFHDGQNDEEMADRLIGVSGERYRRIDVNGPAQEDVCVYSERVLADPGSPMIFLIREDVFDNPADYVDRNGRISLREPLA